MVLHVSVLPHFTSAIQLPDAMEGKLRNASARPSELVAAKFRSSLRDALATIVTSYKAY